MNAHTQISADERQSPFYTGNQAKLLEMMARDPASIPGQRAAKQAKNTAAKATRPAPKASIGDGIPKIGRLKMGYSFAVCLRVLTTGPKFARDVHDDAGLVSSEGMHNRLNRLAEIEPPFLTREKVPSDTHKGVYVWRYTITDEGREALDAWEDAQ